MTCLSALLTIKIVVTLFGAVGPFLFGSGAMAAGVLCIDRPPSLLQRLYGMAVRRCWLATALVSLLLKRAWCLGVF